MTDSQIQKAVIDELRWDPCVRAAKVVVDVKNGVSTLTGSVQSYPEKFAAVCDAERATGFPAISCDLSVVSAGVTQRCGATSRAQLAACGLRSHLLCGARPDARRD